MARRQNYANFEIPPGYSIGDFDSVLPVQPKLDN
jgi:hypothetical protein